MAALSAPQFFAENTAGIGFYKVKGSSNIKKGGMVGITTAGYARPFATGDFFAGHALENADNSSGSDGDIRVQCRRGTYWATVPVFSSATVANIGDSVWTSSDNHSDLTLTDPTGGATTTDLVGYISNIDYDGNVIVRFETRKN